MWREAERTGVLPTADAIAVAHRSIGPETWRLDGATLEVLVPGVRFDFGGLIKGMSVDHAMRLLVDAGTQAALVQSSGESGCFGMSVRGKPHVLGIPDPDAPDGRLWCSVGDQGHGFSGSTSGNYRNAIRIEGKPYYHIFDPRTGQPVDTHVLSVSVAFPMGFRNGLADGLTKVGAVLGWEKMHAIAEKLGGGALVLIRRADGTVEEHASPTWERLLVKSHARLLSDQMASNDLQKVHP
jgi:thiamine biosynthesis lipoprotein